MRWKITSFGLDSAQLAHLPVCGHTNWFANEISMQFGRENCYAHNIDRQKILVFPFHFGLFFY